MGGAVEEGVRDKEARWVEREWERSGRNETGVSDSTNARPVKRRGWHSLPSSLTSLSSSSATLPLLFPAGRIRGDVERAGAQGGLGKERGRSVRAPSTTNSSGVLRKTPQGLPHSLPMFCPVASPGCTPRAGAARRRPRGDVLGVHAR